MNTCATINPSKTPNQHSIKYFISILPIHHIYQTKTYNPTLHQFSEEFEDTKGSIRIRISKNRQHNGQKKKYKRTTNDLQNLHIKLDY